MSVSGNFRERADALKREYDRTQERISEETAALKRCLAEEAAVNEAGLILQRVAQQVQQQAHSAIVGVVSRCLQAVFGDDAYEFDIVFERKRGKTEARLSFRRDGHEVHPTMGAGHGCRDIASFALRIACMMLTKPALRRVLVLDEPFAHVHGEVQRKKARELIETLPTELGVQLILVTGLEWLKAGKIIEV